jgi:hypothetical protein
MLAAATADAEVFVLVLEQAPTAKMMIAAAAAQMAG